LNEIAPPGQLDRYVAGVLSVAYLMTIASAPLDEVQRLIANPSHIIRPTRFEFVSHYLAYSVQIQPLGKTIGLALDGGELIHPDLWHPFRPPLVHFAAAVQDLHQRLQHLWAVELAEHEIADDDWYGVEISKLLSVLGYASNANECLVSALHPPADIKRANRVRMPLATHAT
jgi:hypothetical protein